MDEDAGAAMGTMAAASQARRAERAAELARENEAVQQRLKDVMAVVDVDISDEAAGKARDNYDVHHRGWFGGFLGAGGQ
jgi:hypothetical protein